MMEMRSRRKGVRSILAEEYGKKQRKKRRKKNQNKRVF